MTLQVKNLGFSYKRHDVFRGVSFEVDEGMILSLVGPNGAGKTTLLKCVNRLLPPKTGAVTVMGRAVQTLSRLELARSIAYVPQASPPPFPMTVFDTVLLGRRPYLNWRPRRRDVDLVAEIITRLGLSDMAMRDVNELSGGERQKAVIARAIAQEPKILLLDEPTTYLDLQYQLRIMGFLRELVDEKGLCVVFTTHDLNLALQFSDRMAVLKDGVLVAEGGTGILTEDVILRVYGVEARLLRSGGRPYMAPVRAI
ncbi:MAG: ABC transporter ATP-binding protein [Gracilibacteraceae bacterium]|nr:ABC transporter ATP-binding protein [Gracilibacteraceae bacterium]